MKLTLQVCLIRTLEMLWITNFDILKIDIFLDY